MAPTSSTERDYDEDERATLLGVARDAIGFAMANGRGRPFTLDPSDYPPHLRESRACFVTLTLEGELRGCIGVLEAERPLVAEVAHSARAAAFNDPRFPPLSPGEFRRVSIHVSVLSPAVPIAFADESELVAQLRPGIDGVILQEGGRRGTFLPSVWEGLPQPAEFVRHLKLKAGLPPDYWSSTLKAWRYTSEAFGT